MTDIDNDKDNLAKNIANEEPQNEAQNETSGAAAEPEAQPRASLRDLVLSAGAALFDLDSPAAEEAPRKESVSATESEDQPDLQPTSKTPKKSKGKKRRKVEEPASEEAVDNVVAISWNEEAAGLDFVEATDRPSNPLEELAKRMAETTARKEETSLEAESIEASDDASTEPIDEAVAAAAENEQMELGTFEERLDAAEDDAAAEPQEFIEHDQLVSIIESVLFATDRPVSVASIKQIFKGSNVRTKDITKALDALASEYASLTRGVTLEEINGGFQLRTKSDNAEFLRRLVKTRPFRLSGPALEVMAIVAYKQPITKHQIDEIRGVESGHLLRALMERGLVSFGEKSDLPGKPMTYETTRKFLETFGLRNIRELPTLREIDDLLPEGIGQEEEKETLSDLTDKMSTELTTTYSEGEDELNKISEQLKAVDTTTEFFEQEKQRERDRRDREKAQDIRERLVLGDPVEDKDRRWLERYEAKLHAPPAEAVVEEAPVASSEENPQEATLDASADEVSADADIDAETALDESDDELTARMDWDEDSEKEA